ncbi:hypothetical protein T492DRAFT_1073572, partial [Pavlovales sp. CCMP2436]
AAKAAEAEAAARSKIAATAPARKPVIAATAPARNGEAERIDMRRRSATRRPSSAPPPGSSSSCSRACAASRGPRAQVGGTVAAVGGSGTTCTNCGQRKPDPENPSFVLAEVPKGANKVGKEKSDKAPGPKQLKVWAEKHDVALVQYALAAGYPRLSVTGGKGK